MQEKTFVEKVDYYYDENGMIVLTREFLLKRGKCCNSNCKHCPYKEKLEEKYVK